MNQGICKHYEEKAAKFRQGEQSIKVLERRIKELQCPDKELYVECENISFYMAKERAAELKNLVAAHLQDEIIKIQQELEEL